MWQCSIFWTHCLKSSCVHMCKLPSRESCLREGKLRATGHPWCARCSHTLHSISVNPNSNSRRWEMCGKVSAIWKRLLYFSFLIYKMSIFCISEFLLKVTTKIIWENIFKSIQMQGIIPVIMFQYFMFLIRLKRTNFNLWWPLCKGLSTNVKIMKLLKQRSWASLALSRSDLKYLTEVLLGYVLVFHCEGWAHQLICRLPEMTGWPHWCALWY